MKDEPTPDAAMKPAVIARDGCKVMDEPDADTLILTSDVLTHCSTRQMRMAAKIVRAVLDSGDFMTSDELVELANSGGGHLSTRLETWRHEEAIFCISFNHQNYFPQYALQPDDGYRPHRKLKDIIELFDGKKDGWGIALWFLAANSYLDGRRPKDVLPVDPEAALAAAQEEVRDVMHG